MTSAYDDVTYCDLAGLCPSGCCHLSPRGSRSVYDDVTSAYDDVTYCDLAGLCPSGCCHLSPRGSRYPNNLLPNDLILLPNHLILLPII